MGIMQFSVLLGHAEFTAGAVEAIVATQAVAVGAIKAMPKEELQSYLKLLRLCAAPKATYHLRWLANAEEVSVAAAVQSALSIV